MQLPPADELVMISGLAPIRAKKLRYYEDRNFQNRLAPPPALAVGPYADRPQARPDDWAGIVRPTDSRLGITGDNEAMAEDEGGLQHQRHPGLEEKADKADPGTPAHPAAAERDASDSPPEKQNIAQPRSTPW